MLQKENLRINFPLAFFWVVSLKKVACFVLFKSLLSKMIEKPLILKVMFGERQLRLSFYAQGGCICVWFS